jgi:hypothetical protein
MADISYSSLNTRMEELTRQLKEKDEQLDEELNEVIQASFDELDQEIESDKENLREGLRQKVAAVKKGIKDRKDGLRQKVESAKTGAKDRAAKEAEDALNRMEKNLKDGDLESAYVDRWIANQWLKVSK